MNALTLEWIAKAEGDYASAGREYRARRNPNYDAACFHAQQVAEKYLKAWLQEQSVVFPRTHNLIALTPDSGNYRAFLIIVRICSILVRCFSLEKLCELRKIPKQIMIRLKLSSFLIA